MAAGNHAHIEARRFRKGGKGQQAGEKPGDSYAMEHVHLEITPLTPPPMRKVTSISASAAPVPLETAR